MKLFKTANTDIIGKVSTRSVWL